MFLGPGFSENKTGKDTDESVTPKPWSLLSPAAGSGVADKPHGGRGTLALRMSSVLRPAPVGPSPHGCPGAERPASNGA